MMGSLVFSRMSSGRRGSKFMKGTCAAEQTPLLPTQELFGTARIRAVSNKACTSEAP